MTEKEKNKKAFSTCLEDLPFAEMMQKMTSKQGIGSICAEMMKKAGAKKGDSCSFTCTEMMRSMMKGCFGVTQETKEAKKEEDHVGEK
jgi:hypothetical protein